MDKKDFYRADLYGNQFPTRGDSIDADKVIKEGETLQELNVEYGFALFDSHSDLLTVAKQQRDRIHELEKQLAQFQPMVSCGFADEVYYHKVKPKEPS